MVVVSVVTPPDASLMTILRLPVSEVAAVSSAVKMPTATATMAPQRITQSMVTALDTSFLKDLNVIYHRSFCYVKSAPTFTIFLAAVCRNRVFALDYDQFRIGFGRKCDANWAYAWCPHFLPLNSRLLVRRTKKPARGGLFLGYGGNIWSPALVTV